MVRLCGRARRSMAVDVRGAMFDVSCPISVPYRVAVALASPSNDSVQGTLYCSTQWESEVTAAIPKKTRFRYVRDISKSTDFPKFPNNHTFEAEAQECHNQWRLVAQCKFRLNPNPPTHVQSDSGLCVLPHVAAARVFWSDRDNYDSQTCIPIILVACISLTD